MWSRLAIHGAGPRVLVGTGRDFDAHDGLVREYYALEPYINGMVKNGRRAFSMDVRDIAYMCVLSRRNWNIRVLPGTSYFISVIKIEVSYSSYCKHHSLQQLRTKQIHSSIRRLICS